MIDRGKARTCANCHKTKSELRSCPGAELEEDDNAEYVSCNEALKAKFDECETDLKQVSVTGVKFLKNTVLKAL